MELFYKSTRSKDKKISAAEAIIKGICSDGGLYVPEEIPTIDKKFSELTNMDYKEVAFYIMKKYFTDFKEDELKKCIDKAYDSKFESSDIAPLVEEQGIYFLELYHGPTLAFKDMALSILPHLMKTACKKLNYTKEIVILTATSGDTGKAALEGFANVEGTKIIVFFPESGVSEVQKRQMNTQEGENVFVVGIEGNFDDAQRAVKEVFNDDKINKKLEESNYMFSSANSINIGRLVPQIVYYVYSYLNMLKNKKIKENEEINVVVPTGNFGNILAAYYAKKMGLPINKFICASNENKVLTDFVNNGVYDTEREFIITNSPSMDILISSNLERFLYHISGGDEALINQLMIKLKEEGKYEINNKMREAMKDFYGGFAYSEDALKGIKEMYEGSNYVMDTHTSVAYNVYKEYVEKTEDNRKTVIASTASPFKFTRSVNDALQIGDSKYDDFKLIRELSSKLKINIPNGIKNLDKKEIIHNRVCKKNEIKDVILNILKV